MTDGTGAGAVSAEMIRADTRVCVGSAMCVTMAPGAFELGPDRKVQVRQTLGETELEDLLDAEEGCPVSAITILREGRTA